MCAAFIADFTGATINRGIGKTPVTGGSAVEFPKAPVARCLALVTGPVDKRQFAQASRFAFWPVIAARPHGYIVDFSRHDGKFSTHR